MSFQKVSNYYCAVNINRINSILHSVNFCYGSDLTDYRTISFESPVDFQKLSNFIKKLYSVEILSKDASHSYNLVFLSNNNSSDFDVLDNLLRTRCDEMPLYCSNRRKIKDLYNLALAGNPVDYGSPHFIMDVDMSGDASHDARHVYTKYLSTLKC